MSTLPDNATEPMQKAMQRAVMLRKSMNDVWRAALAELPEPATDTAAEVERLRQALREIQRLRACVLEMDAARKPLNDAQALELARKHLDKGLSWAPHITRCTDLEIRALIRAVEAEHGIGA